MLVPNPPNVPCNLGIPLKAAFPRMLKWVSKQNIWRTKVYLLLSLILSNVLAMLVLYKEESEDCRSWVCKGKELFRRSRWRLYQPKWLPVVFTTNHKIYAAHASQHSIQYWLLVWSGYSSHSTKELHGGGNTSIFGLVLKSFLF